MGSVLLSPATNLRPLSIPVRSVRWLLGQAEGACLGITPLPATQRAPAWAPRGEGCGRSSSSGAERSGPRAAGVGVSRVPGDPRPLAAQAAPLAGAGQFLPEEASRRRQEALPG